MGLASEVASSVGNPDFRCVNVLFHFVSMSIRAMVSSILISSFSFLFGFAGDLVCPSMVSSSVVRTECPSISFLFVRLGNMGIMS